MPKQVPVEKNRGGEWIAFGDEEYRVPPLGFRDIRDLAEEVQSLRTIEGMPTVEQMNTVEKIVHAALKRNYPSMPLEDVADMLDMSNYQRVLVAVLNIGGYKTGEAAGPPGEALASTGTASTSP